VYGRLQAVPLGKEYEERFRDYLNKDRVLHIFTIYDLGFVREKTKVWMALRSDEIVGYLFEYDKRIIHARGASESITELLQFIDLGEAVFSIEPHHLAKVEQFFEPIEPTDPASRGKTTAYLVMKTDRNNFQPVIRHHIRKLGTEDLDETSKSLGQEYRERVEDAINRGLAFGAYDDESLASIATVPEMLEDLAFIRGVYTVPSLRGRGLATSACSALVAEAIRLGRQALLWVAEDNVPARKVYERIGFKPTGHTLLGFKARRRHI